MTLVDPRPILEAARERRGGVGAFNVTLLEHAEAIVTGAERAAAPVILQISENAVNYHGDLAPIGLATLRIASSSPVPVAVHLDHAESTGLVRQAVALGFTSVMYDGSNLPVAENLAATREMAAFCHAAGVAVEAELGAIGGKGGAHTPGVRTDPGEAADFVASTGVDWLAVAVGSSHAMATRDAALDLELIARMAETVPVPLVLHGSSGVSDENMAGAIRAGMTKINVATHLNKVFTARVREVLAGSDTIVDARKYVGPAREAMAQEVERLLGVLLATGTA
ncbi:MAG: class II fructose-bisphosphate aldolase [Propionicimonas sp.]|jgi:fructose-bisphosphate aldolase class II